MRPDEAARVSQMIAVEFSAIVITVNSNRETYDPSLAGQIPEGNVLVTFEIPREGVSMPDFYKEFFNALNQESSMPQKERER
jgi:hypothetical protein